MFRMLPPEVFKPDGVFSAHPLVDTVLNTFRHINTMQLEKPRQSLQGQKPNLAAHKDAAEKRALTLEEQAELNADLRDATNNVLMPISKIEMLLDKGANIETKHSHSGWTPLLSSAFWGRADTCALLLSRGANVHAKDNAGWTALMNAASNGHIMTCAILLEKGANIFITNEKGNTALMIAESKRLDKTAAFLRFFESLSRASFFSAFRECIS
jgi:ankyrin repeat protein